MTVRSVVLLQKKQQCRELRQDTRSEKRFFKKYTYKKKKYRDRAADVIHIAEVEEFFEVPVEGQQRQKKPRVGGLVRALIQP
jgi:hypothetical protein